VRLEAEAYIVGRDKKRILQVADKRKTRDQWQQKNNNAIHSGKESSAGSRDRFIASRVAADLRKVSSFSWRERLKAPPSIRLFDSAFAAAAARSSHAPPFHT
jgi:hypothetical protein